MKKGRKKVVTLSDIAQKANLSKGAVSFALKNSPMVSEKTRKMVQALAKSMGYEKNQLVSTLMSKIRASKSDSFYETIAVINGNLDEHALRRHPTLPRYYEGIREESERLGYAINEFWMHTPGITPEKLAKIFHSRGIRGGIVLGHSFGNEFPEGYEKIWHDFYFVSAGIRTYNASLEVVASDDFLISYNSYIEVSNMGFKNIGIVVEESTDDLVGGALIGGYLRAQMKRNPRYICPPFIENENSPSFRKDLEKWLESNKPDAILYLLDSTREILSKIKKVGNARLFQLEKRGYVKNWVGMEQNNDLVGRVAVRRLADMLNRVSAIAGENSNMITLVRPTWVGGGEAAKDAHARPTMPARPRKAKRAK